MKSVFRATNTMILAVALTATLGLAQRASAQTALPQSQQAEVPTSYDYRVSTATAVVMSFDQVKSITQSAIRESIGEQLDGITTSDVSAKLAGSREKLLHGQSVEISASLTSVGAHSLTQQHVLQASVNFDARPIGGILTIKVALVPLFSGIGSASRPVVLKTSTTAVDKLDETYVAAIISDLSHQLGNQYAAK